MQTPTKITRSGFLDKYLNGGFASWRKIEDEVETVCQLTGVFPRQDGFGFQWGRMGQASGFKLMDDSGGV
jgi:hypothetical protein